MCGFHLTARWRLRSKLKNSIILVTVNHVGHNFGRNHLFVLVSTYKTIEYTSNNRKYIQNPKRNFYFCVRIRKHIMISSKSVSLSLLENIFFTKLCRKKNLAHKIDFRVLHESFLVSKDCQQAILSSSSEVKIVSDSISSISHVTSEIDEFRSSKRSSRVSTL